MSGIQLTDDQKQEILRRGTEAQAFIHSPLFVAFKQWVEQEDKLMVLGVALDKRADTQQKLTRQEFVEQMAGYYRGIHTALTLFQGFIDKARELQKFITKEEEIKKEETDQQVTMETLRKQAYPNEQPKSTSKK